MLETPSLESKETIIGRILNEDNIWIIQKNNLKYISDNSTNEELEIILKYLQNIPKQWWQIAVLISLIWTKNIALLIENVSIIMLSSIILYSNINWLTRLWYNSYYK